MKEGPHSTTGYGLTRLHEVQGGNSGMHVSSYGWMDVCRQHGSGQTNTFGESENYLAVAQNADVRFWLIRIAFVEKITCVVISKLRKVWPFFFLSLTAVDCPGSENLSASWKFFESISKPILLS